MNYYKPAKELKQDYRGELPPPKPAWPEVIRSSTDCIHNFLYVQKLTVSWMQQQCQITGKNFAAKFALYKGYTPKQYILHHRLQTGKILLTKLDISITQTALSVGFSSLSTFSKAFKRSEGLRPSEWRSGK